MTKKKTEMQALADRAVSNGSVAPELHDDFLTCIDQMEADGSLDESPVCAWCGGETVPLGKLGTRSHYRCRACGMGVSS